MYQAAQTSVAMDSNLQAIQASWHLYFPFDNFDPSASWASAALLFRNFFKIQGKGLLAGFVLDTATEICFGKLQ